MDLTESAIKYLTELGLTDLMEVNGQQYSTKQLYRVTALKPSKISTTTLTSLVDYLKSNFDAKSSEKLLIHVISPNEVSLYSELREDKDREEYLNCNALTPDNIRFNSFIDAEAFNIMIQSSFVDNDDKGIVLKVTGCITENNVQDTSDDGISQAVTVKTGIAKLENVLVPNPVTLAPYRTFPEIIQPESQFILRMKAGQNGPSAALFQADGGAWRNEAMESIKEYLKAQLVGLKYIEIIS